MKRLLVLLIVLLTGSVAVSQGVFISRFIPGSLSNPGVHRIEIFNPSGKSVDISGWLLSTHEYCLRIPPGTRLGAESGWSAGLPASGFPAPDLNLSDKRTRIYRNYQPRQSGGYAILFDRNHWLIDGMYFAPGITTDFLPREIDCGSESPPTGTLKIPGPEDDYWAGKVINMSRDPAVYFIQVAGNWVPAAANINLLPATEYQDFEGEFRNGIVALNWSTKFEDQSYRHFVERSEDGITFQQIASVPAAKFSRESSEYEFLDDQIREGDTIWYRISNRDIYGNIVRTASRQVVTSEESGDFSLEVFSTSGPEGEELNVRYVSALPCRLNLKLLDARYREVAILFDGPLRAGEQQLLKITERLTPGRYLLLADTGFRRYGQMVELGRP